MQNNISSLDHYDFIRVSGADTLSFLQGQLSCNTELLSPQRSLRGALCNLKGRVVADFRLLALGDDCLLQCAQGMASTILATLSKYAVFSKVTLEQLDKGVDASPNALGLSAANVDAALGALGLTLPESTDAVSEGEACSVIRLSGTAKRIELWFHNASAKANFLSSTDFALSEDLLAWERADIETGVIHVTKELSEEYTPQLLNYDISGLIDFKKGCYTGQEIVARMYYRGTAKKRLYLAGANADVSAQSRVVKEGEPDSTGFEILRYSNSEGSSLFLTILASEAVEAGEKFLLSDQPGSELRIQSLPYGD